MNLPGNSFNGGWGTKYSCCACRSNGCSRWSPPWMHLCQTLLNSVQSLNPTQLSYLFSYVNSFIGQSGSLLPVCARRVKTQDRSSLRPFPSREGRSAPGSKYFLKFPFSHILYLETCAALVDIGWGSEMKGLVVRLPGLVVRVASLGLWSIFIMVLTIDKLVG